MKNRNKVLVSAAIAGLLAGTLPNALNAEHHDQDHKPVPTASSDVKNGCSGADGCGGMNTTKKGTPVPDEKADKESCKSKDSCKAEKDSCSQKESCSHN
jgi:hypothetical protein